MSGDPEVQDPYHSQSYNRYSYVWNNPTNFTDPTGFEVDEPVKVIIYGPPKAERNREREQEWSPLHIFWFNLTQAAKGQPGTNIHNPNSPTRHAEQTYRELAAAAADQPWYFQFPNPKTGMTQAQMLDDAGNMMGHIADAEEDNYAPLALDGGLAVLGGAAARAGGGSTTTVCCFAAGTPVLMDKGKKAIELVRIGDQVVSRDPETGEISIKEVEDVFKVYHESIRDLVYRTESGKVDHLRVSEDHPFWVQSKGWVQTADLKPGMKLWSFGGKPLTVVKMRSIRIGQITYNLTVSDFHTYFVGNANVWVHNDVNCAHLPRDTVLHRRGGPDTKGGLASQAKAALANEKVNTHGVSTSLDPTPKYEGQQVRSATVGEITDKGMNIKQTGSDPNHHTVEIPHPVTPDFVRMWNDVFK
jgi:hypothetical protein